MRKSRDRRRTIRGSKVHVASGNTEPDPIITVRGGISGRDRPWRATHPIRGEKFTSAACARARQQIKSADTLVRVNRTARTVCTDGKREERPVPSRTRTPLCAARHKGEIISAGRVISRQSRRLSLAYQSRMPLLFSLLPVPSPPPPPPIPLPAPASPLHDAPGGPLTSISFLVDLRPRHASGAVENMCERRSEQLVFLRTLIWTRSSAANARLSR